MMIRLFTILLFSILVVSCTNRKLTKKEIAAANKCRDNWQYINLQDTVSGEVLYHAKASFGCGVLTSASLTIIKTTEKDTIRILWRCNTEIDFKVNQRVKIIPEQQTAHPVMLPLTTSQFDCIIYRTYYGNIKSF